MAAAAPAAAARLVFFTELSLVLTLELFPPEHGHGDIGRRAEQIGPNIVGLGVIVLMSQPQKRFLIGVTHILFAA